MLSYKSIPVNYRRFFTENTDHDTSGNYRIIIVILFQHVEKSFVDYEKRLIKLTDIGQELQERVSDGGVVERIEAAQDR